MTTSRILFDARERTLQVYDSGGSIVSVVSGISKSICPLIQDGTIKIDTKIGEGAQGKVYLITVGDEKRQYVMKSAEAGMSLKPLPNGEDRDQIFAVIAASLNVDPSIIHDMNPGIPKITNNNTVNIPEFASECYRQNEIEYTNNLTQNIITVPPGSYTCNEGITEYLISLILGEIRRREESIFFIDTFAVASCKREDSNKFYYFTFMERVDGTLSNMLNDNLELIDQVSLTQSIPKYTSGQGIDINGILIHTLLAISKLQEYGIQHNDLHLNNIFYQKITPDTVFRGQRLMDYQYFSFNLNGKPVYTKNAGIIIKIADFGFSMKFENPQIINKTIMADEYDTLIPNFRLDIFDPLLVLYQMYTMLNVRMAKSLIARSIFSKADIADSTVEILMFGDEGVERPKIQLARNFYDVNADFLLGILDNEWFQKPQGTIAYL